MSKFLVKLSLTVIMMVSVCVAFGQTKTITGTVTDSAGAPLSGASVTIKGTSIGASTNANGRFSLNSTRSDGTIIVSYAGYKTQEVAFAGTGELKVQLTQEIKAGEEVIVIGYGTRKREAISGSVASISSKDIGNTHAGSQVSNTLAGKLPGLSFRQADGRPGAAAGLQIRNFGPALYVIDGVQSDENSFNSLNGEDIESISILKDASAAVYGLRGANGVVLVTTKKESWVKNPPSLLTFLMAFRICSGLQKCLPAPMTICVTKLRAR